MDYVLTMLPRVILCLVCIVLGYIYCRIAWLVIRISMIRCIEKYHEPGGAFLWYCIALVLRIAVLAGILYVAGHIVLLLVVGH